MTLRRLTLARRRSFSSMPLQGVPRNWQADAPLSTRAVPPSRVTRFTVGRYLWKALNMLCPLISPEK